MFLVKIPNSNKTTSAPNTTIFQGRPVCFWIWDFVEQSKQISLRHRRRASRQEMPFAAPFSIPFWNWWERNIRWANSINELINWQRCQTVSHGGEGGEMGVNLSRLLIAPPPPCSRFRNTIVSVPWQTTHIVILHSFVWARWSRQFWNLGPTRAHQSAPVGLRDVIPIERW